MEGLFLDARYDKGVLTLYFLSNKIEEINVKAHRIAYIEPTSIELYNVLNKLSFIYEIIEEEWFLPPYYDFKRPIIKIKYLGSSKFIKRIEENGLGVHVNNFPDEINLILREKSLRPGYLYDTNTLEMRDNDDPLYKLPEIRYAYVTSLNKYGKEASWYDIKYYKVSINNKDDFVIENIEELYDIIKENEISIVMADVNSLNEIKSQGFILIQKPLVGIYGLIEWSRISGLTLRQASNSSIGKILTSAEALEAIKRHYEIKKVKRVEPWRKLGDMKDADRAGATFIPKPGVYFNVYQLDFSSLYPNIIVLNNLSAETVNKNNCIKYEINAIGHKVCFDKEGLVPSVLKRLIDRREKIRPYKKDLIFKERFDAIKWILVTGFGYLGYRNSLFGSVSAYESVTYIAREIMKKSYEISNKNGYKVINYIIDSLFLIPENPKIDIEELSETISKEVNIKLRVEDKFLWLVFPYTERCLGSAGRYYGLKDDGTLKIKGINAVRKNVPDIIKYAETNALNVLKKASNKEEFYNLLIKAKESYDNVKKELINGDVKEDLLVISKSINKIGNTQQARASRILYGLSDSISYIINSDGNPIPVEFYEGNYSKEYYLKYLERSEIEMPWYIINKNCNTS
ncbi:MAG: DNA polymerase domain-containing protein [Caldisphaera sp.]|uniref:DNA polymerase domain-containing protein n=1 Tax=Caldisphaera sp. TaxID=2060322 RepID=UPI003D10E28E